MRENSEKNDQKLKESEKNDKQKIQNIYTFI